MEMASEIDEFAEQLRSVRKPTTVPRMIYVPNASTWTFGQPDDEPPRLVPGEFAAERQSDEVTCARCHLIVRAGNAIDGICGDCR
jgi:hypothetical protein